MDACHAGQHSFPFDAVVHPGRQHPLVEPVAGIAFSKQAPDERQVGGGQQARLPAINLPCRSRVYEQKPAVKPMATGRNARAGKPPSNAGGRWE